MSKTKIIKPTSFQSAVLQFRGHCGIINAGGRGSGKSFSMSLDLLSHCQEFGEDARPLVLRESHGGLQELQNEAFNLCVNAWGATVTRNKHAGTMELPTGGIITFACVSDEATYAKLQGRSFTGLYADEAGNYSPNGFAFMLRALSNLRVPPGQRPSIHITANPHGRAHTQVYKTWISKAPAWHPFKDPETGLTWVWTTSDYTQNPHIDQDQYLRNLRASCGSDTALAEAWIKGDWSVLGGVMFDVFDPKIHIIPPVTVPLDATYRVGADWGTASPSTALLIARLSSPVGRYIGGDYIVLDETNTADPRDLSVGLGHPPTMFAEMVREMTNRNGVKKFGMVIDDARGLQGDTVVGFMRGSGISAWRPAQKDRIGGWNLIRQLLFNAKTGEGGQGLWVTTRCPHLLETLPEAPRGTLRAEDIDPKFNRDHHIDALRYGLVDLQGNRLTCRRVEGVPS